MVKLKFKSIVISILLCLISLSTIVYADDSTTRSIVGDYFNKVFEVELNEGKGLTEIQTDAEERKKINDSIYDGTIDKNYSLYDRFGGSIKFIPYFGETKISTGLFDRFYSYLIDNNAEMELNQDIILALFESPAISNNVVYENRPNILSSEDIEAGNMDPRVYTYSGISSVGGDAALGNTMLEISNIITTTIGWSSGSGLYNTINDIWKQACEAGLENILSSMVKFFLPLAVVIFVITLISKVIKVLKGQESGRKILENLLSVGISLGLIFSLMVNPMAFSDVLTKVVTLMDNTLDIAIQIDANEIVKSDNTKNVRLATLWSKSVFDPWCDGMFGSGYEELYTQYDENPDHKKMEQSHDDVKNEWNDGSVKYDSKSLTGDAKIQVGKDKWIRNWAALAWSTQSIYHIDAVEGKDKQENDIIENSKDEENLNAWPKATTTPMNDQIFIDNFRWLDAKLNISPEYRAPDKIIMNYSNSNNYSQNFVSSGMNSIYMSLLLIPIGILSFRKIKNALKIVSSGFRLVYQSTVNLVMPEKYNIVSNLQNLIKPVYDFFWWSMMIFLAITTYSKLTGSTVVGDFVWVIVGIYLCKFKPIRTPRQLRSVMDNAKRKISYTSRNLVSGLERKINKNKH